MGKRAKNPRKSRNKAVLPALIFLAGLALLLYPSLSNWYYSWRYERDIADWEAAREPEDYSAMWAAAEAYNRSLAQREAPLSLAADETEAVSGLLDPLGTGMMGFVDIEKIGVHLPVYQGTEEKQLQSGAGWWIGTSLPTGGAGTHCVITAHTGLVKAKLFTDLDQLELGDIFTLSILDRVLTYEVDQILVTEPEDLSPLEIVPGEDYATLYTCTPYGVNTHRLLVRGRRTAAAAEHKEPPPTENAYGGPFLPAATAAFVPTALLARAFRRRKRPGKRVAAKKQRANKRGDP